jgi:hypothetical protein
MELAVVDEPQTKVKARGRIRLPVVVVVDWQGFSEGSEFSKLLSPLEPGVQRNIKVQK